MKQEDGSREPSQYIWAETHRSKRIYHSGIARVCKQLGARGAAIRPCMAAGEAVCGGDVPQDQVAGPVAPESPLVGHVDGGFLT